MFNETLTLVQTCGIRISHNLDFSYLCGTVTTTHTRSSSITSCIFYQTPKMHTWLLSLIRRTH